MESRSNEVPVRQENESRLDEIHSCRENEKGQEEDLERVRSEMKQQEAPFWEENEKKLGVAKTEDAEKFVQVCDKDGSETDVNLDHKLNEFPVAEYERICELEKNTEEVTFQLDENDKDDSESEIGPFMKKMRVILYLLMRKDGQLMG
ncbi:hypothetical protein GH714_006121 [Hevea brasiliensis]|uniref:Uncharacterized protein n=1 Tax=Hevea brasiliensis TaxID=3981 RepID=A0A6A6M8J3_HEVBR|nr:hypothetical protein GH714_006121 [Hevea brasiliensis]